MKNIAYFGIDVHKDTNSIHLSAIKPDYEKIDVFIGKVSSDPKTTANAITKALSNYGLDGYEIMAGYESGPTGFPLCNYLNSVGIHCVVMATTSLAHASGDRVKTDRLDAAKLANALQTDGYKPVYVPSSKCIATREFARFRNDRLRRLKTIKQQIKSFLLRHSKNFSQGRTAWTNKFINWLKTLEFENIELTNLFKYMLSDYFDAVSKLEEIDLVIDEKSHESEYEKDCDKLAGFAGMNRQYALSLLCEIGDFSRFADAEQLSSYAGLIPSEDSSGGRIKRGAITKAGNAIVRTIAVEVCKSIKRTTSQKSKALIKRQAVLDAETISYVDRGTKRIKNRMYKLENVYGKNANVAVAAGAREFMCFVWGLMNSKLKYEKEGKIEKTKSSTEIIIDSVIQDNGSEDKIYCQNGV